MVYLRKRLTLKPEGAAQLHVHSEACGVDESQWEEKERFAVSCNIGGFQCRFGD